MKRAAFGTGIVLPCHLQHRFGDVHAVAAIEVPGHRVRETTHTAAEIERPPPRDRDAKPGGALEHVIDFRDPAAEELGDVPAAALFGGIGEDSPIRIAASEPFPMSLKRRKLHVVNGIGLGPRGEHSAAP